VHIENVDQRAVQHLMDVWQLPVDKAVVFGACKPDNLGLELGRRYQILFLLNACVCVSESTSDLERRTFQAITKDDRGLHIPWQDTSTLDAQDVLVVDFEKRINEGFCSIELLAKQHSMNSDDHRPVNVALLFFTFVNLA
jgi:hypothetical protein